MEGLAHGWKPSGMKNPPSSSVAKDFVEADKKNKAYKNTPKISASRQAQAIEEGEN
jgi:hypothetical protein